MAENVQTTTQTPWSTQVPYLEEMFRHAGELFANQGAQPNYPGSRVAGFTPAQQWAQNYQQSYAQGAAPQMASQAQSAWGNLLNSTDVNNNPALQGAIDVAQRRTSENLTQNVLPHIGSAAQANGAYGGARHGIVEGQAVGDTAQAMGDIATNMTSAAYGQGLQASLAALGMTGAVQNAGLAPAAMMDQVGQQQQGQNQRLIDQEVENWFYNQNAPWDALGRYSAAIQGQYGGTQSTPVSHSSSTMGALGGAAAGTALGGELGANNNIMALLALLGAWGGSNG